MQEQLDSCCLVGGEKKLPFFDLLLLKSKTFIVTAIVSFISFYWKHGSFRKVSHFMNIINKGVIAYWLEQLLSNLIIF